MAFLEFIGTLALIAVVSLSLIAVWDIFRPRPAKAARAKRSAEYVRARSSSGS
ncbi:hypothetical protein AWB74_07969 [Caballeronia arvi]|uniref:Uncharacterized protein n=1 Tax=Caballeronia arvi TaxID=1777135 RepID=A0A158L139_9BURK|nr:hypothetical protein [Caballeronia arvi]SAL87094.1 hypothetical protein AWB74_07969 [Caballeronia arvi]